MAKEIMKREPDFNRIDGVVESENHIVDIDSSYPVVDEGIMVRQEINGSVSRVVTRRMSPKKVAYEGGGTSPLFLDFLQKNPEIFLRKSSFDGMGEPLTSDDLDGEKAFLYECEILDYDAPNKDTGELEHFHYSVWLGVRDRDNLSFVYSAGKQLTELAEALILPENATVKEDVSARGIHVIFNMIKLKSDPKKSFMKVDVIP